MAQPDSVPNALTGLRDVAGVVGSFVVSPMGEPLARDLPKLFTDELITTVAPRVATLIDGVATDMGELDLGVLRFDDHTLYLRRVRGATLCVLSAAQVNAPALRMGMNLVARRIEPLLSVAAVPTTPPPTKPPEPAPSALQWRGRPMPKVR